MTFRQDVGDFFAPFFRVRFIDIKKIDGMIAYDESGEELLNVQEAAVTAEAVASGDTTTFKIAENEQMSHLRSFASSITITTEGGFHTTAQFNMEPQYEDAIRIIDSEAIQWNALMVVEYGYLSPKTGIVSENKYSKTGVFMIQKPDLTLSADGAQIEIIGVDLLSYTLMKRETYREWDRKNANYKTDLGIIRELVERNGMTLDTQQVGLSPTAEFSSAFNSSLPADTHSLQIEHPIGAEPEKLEQFESDWTFFQRLVFSNNCNFYTQGGTVYLVDMNEAKGAQANYRLIMFQQPQHDYDVLMTSFQTGVLPTLFWPPEAKSVRAVTTDPDTGKPKNAAKEDEEEIKDYDPTQESDNENQGPKTSGGKNEPNAGSSTTVDGQSLKPNPKYEENQTGKGFYMTWGTPNRQELSKQTSRWANLKSGVSAEATIVGTPAVETMQIVEVRGVGKVMSGFYLVKKATHMLDGGGYETQLELIREGSSGDPVAGKGTQPAATADATSAEGGAAGEAVPAQIAGN